MTSICFLASLGLFNSAGNLLTGTNGVFNAAILRLSEVTPFTHLQD